MGKRKVLNESALKELQLPQEGEMFGRVIKLLGGENLLVKCADGVTRRGRIRGKLKRRVWIRDNDIVIIAPGNLDRLKEVIFCGDTHYHKQIGLNKMITYQKISKKIISLNEF